jgi:hypothetical protein
VLRLASGFLALCLAVALPACALAIPVRCEPMTTSPVPPSAKVPPGTTRTVSDAPDLTPVVAGLLDGVLDLFGGPLGKLAGGAAATLLGLAVGHHVGHKRGRRAAGSLLQPRTAPA